MTTHRDPLTVGHGYTCEWCQWGRDSEHARYAWVMHMEHVHPDKPQPPRWSPTSPQHLVDDGYLVEPEPPTVPELAHWAATGRPPRRYLAEPEPLDDLASAWRSCLVRAALLALALILVGLVAAQLARAS